MNLSGTLTGPCYLGMGVVDTTACIPDSRWPSNLPGRLTLGVPRETVMETLTGQPNFTMGVFDTAVSIQTSQGTPSLLKRSTRSLLRGTLTDPSLGSEPPV